ncbi:MAG TPA: hypothetical protein GXZ64_09520 [Clostridiaceae bacterium]|jgi:vacuolar-type H+-ATPase subunit E/Vma4|nr:hypothetical protein [Clostridiaceae bacterium]
MDGLDRLLQSIEDEADSRIADIRDEAKRYAEQIIADAEAHGRSILDSENVRAKLDAEQMIARAESLMRADQRKADLGRRQGDVDRLIREALDTLRRKSRDERVTLYAGIIRSRGLAPGEIVLGAGDQDIGQALLARLPEGFTLAAESGAFDGGFVVRRGSIEENMTYELAVRNNRPELAQLATRLISDEKA